MRRMLFIACLLLVLGVDAKQKIVTGKVTHVSADAVFTSLGRERGIRDSTLVYVISRGDTAAVLKAFAVSSQSSACRIVRMKRAISIGNDVIALLSVSENGQTVSDKANGSRNGQRAGKSVRKEAESIVTIEGRVTAQYLTTRYENSSYDFSQPGIFLNLRGTARDLPLKFEMYSTIRSSSVGGTSPFSSNARNQTRLYRLLLGYDDGETVVSVGRILPQFAVSAGYVDGVLFSKRFGTIVVGSSFGFQPDLSLRGPSTDLKKIALFANYRSEAPMNISISTAYARTYFQSQLDRELIGLQVHVISSSALFVFATSEVDLRKKSGGELVSSPSLTNGFINVNYRLTNFATVSLGADASRPFNSFSSVRSVPDSLLDDCLRTGLNMGISFSLPGGVMLYNTYTPRTSGSSFGREYSNYSSLNFSDVLSTGTNVRSHVVVNENTYARSRGYGFNVQKNFNGMFDLSLRYQQYLFTIRQVDERDRSSTVGADILVPITNQWSALLSYDRLNGYGSNSHSLYAEINVRF